MATVEVTFSPLPAHVRTARLVATAVARRSGVPEALLDEVRLAVGEACSRAVEAHQAHCPEVPIRVTLTDQGGRFEIEVINASAVPAQSEQAAGADPMGAAEQGDSNGEPGDGDQVPHGFSLAVIAGLADDVRISETPAGTSVWMSWPSASALASGAPVGGSSG